MQVFSLCMFAVYTLMMKKDRRQTNILLQYLSLRRLVTAYGHSVVLSIVMIVCLFALMIVLLIYCVLSIFVILINIILVMSHVDYYYYLYSLYVATLYIERDT